MTAPLAPVPALASKASGKADPDKLLGAAKQLEAMFVRQLFQAMRTTVSDEGVMSGGSAGETFQQLFDEHVADQTPTQWKHGLAEAVARQFARAGMVADARAGSVADASSGRPVAPTENR